MINNEQRVNESTEVSLDPNAHGGEDHPEAKQNEPAEFKITLRKLELPVRPRGVLAE